MRDVKENRKEDIFTAAAKCFNENGIQSGKFIPIDSEAITRAIVLITIGAFNAYFTLDADFDLPKQHNFNITHMLKALKNNHTP